jgi:hypothetical protein
MSLRQEIETALNKASAENNSNTPDFVLAEYLLDSLAAFDKATNRREEWYGRRKDSLVLAAEASDAPLTP